MTFDPNEMKVIRNQLMRIEQKVDWIKGAVLGLSIFIFVVAFYERWFA